MKCGALRHRVQIQVDELHGVMTAGGGPQEPRWVTLGARFANVVPLSGRERFTAQQVQSDVTHRVEMHYDPTLQARPVHRLLFNDRPFEIESVINVGELGRETHVMCKEAVA